MEGWNALLCALVCFFISINGQISNIDNGIYGKDGSPEELIYTNGLNYASMNKDGSLEKGIDTNGINCIMADLREKLEQQNSELKLQLNASQQARATMQLELTQKDEMNKQDLKRLKEELNENFNLLEADAVKELEQMLKEANAREAKALSDLNQNYQKILEQFDEMISEWYTRVQAKNKEHAEKYESLKIYYKNQLDKSNKDILGIMEKYDSEMNKLRAQIKRLEIKCGSLEMALQQKTKECEQLATLRRD